MKWLARCLVLLAICLIVSANARADTATPDLTGEVDSKSTHEQVRLLREQVQQLQAQVDAQKDLLSISQSLHERNLERLSANYDSRINQMQVTYDTTVEKLQDINTWFFGVFTVFGLVTWFLGLPALQKYLEERLVANVAPKAEVLLREKTQQWDEKSTELITKYEKLFAAKYREYSRPGA